MKFKTYQHIRKNINDANGKKPVSVDAQTREASMKQSGWDFPDSSELFYTMMTLPNNDSILVGGFAPNGDQSKLGLYGSGASRSVQKGSFGITQTTTQEIPLTNIIGPSNELTKIIAYIENVSESIKISQQELGPDNRRNIADFTIIVDDTYTVHGDLTVNNVTGNNLGKKGTVALKVYEVIGHGSKYLTNNNFDIHGPDSLFDVMNSKQKGSLEFQGKVRQVRNRLTKIIDEAPIDNNYKNELMTVYNT